MVSLNKDDNLISKYVNKPSTDFTDVVLSDKYSLKRRSVGDGWLITHAVVTETATGRVALEVFHRYSNFPYSFFERDGSSYLLCTPESYQELVIVNLDTEVVYPIDTKSWCFSWGLVSPDGNRFAAQGCYWASSYDTRIYNIKDLNNPVMELEEGLESDPSEEKWIDNDHFYYKFISFIGKDGKDQDSVGWNSHAVIKDSSEPNGFRIESVPGNKTFDDQGEYTKEFLDNFTSEKTIDIGKPK